MSRCIDADALETHEQLEPFGNGEYEYVEVVYKDDIDDAPTIEPERKTGRWIPQDHNKKHGNATTCVYYYPVCSECGHTGDFNMNYCPNCGAEMLTEDKE